MFFPGSRYEKMGTYQVDLAGGRTVLAVRIPQPGPPAVAGFHARLEGDRLDLLAARYLGDATTFWRLCDANDAMVPDALAARPLIGVPVRGR